MMIAFNLKLISKRKLQQALALLVIVLMFNLPVVAALEISEVSAVEVTENGASIQWKTDEPADSFVSYGTAADNLKVIGDADLVTSHQVGLSDLSPSTTYSYGVESNDLVENNSGNWFTFTTLAPDVAPPEINAALPEIVAGDRLDFNGTAEIGAKVYLQVNGFEVGSTFAWPEKETASGTEAITGSSAGIFQFSNVFLQGDASNKIVLTAVDKSGNNASWQSAVFSDVHKPKLELEKVSDLVGTSTLELKGNISENASYEVLVNNISAAKGEGITLAATVNLKDGKNGIQILLKDRAGWESSRELEVYADTLPPTLKVEIEKGYEYYEGRAVSDINGETEQGATAYLYLYRPLQYEFKPSFEKAIAKATADSNGRFTFHDIDFSASSLTQALNSFAPKEIPSGLQESYIYPIQQLAEMQYQTDYLYIIVEDRSGKNAYWEGKVNIHSCYSPSMGFGVESVPEFQMPLHLVPQLLDQGRQEIQAVFSLNYLGNALPQLDLKGEVVEQGFRINSVRIDKACTQNMQEDEKFGLGCKILPNSYSPLKNNDGTKLYVTWKLNSAKEVSQEKNSFWDDFKKRQVVFPLKIDINYQEKEGMDQWSEPKTQTVCYDLGYFIDRPIDTQEMIPDYLANEGVTALNWTITQMETARKYVEEAFFWSAVTCMGSFFLKTVTRIARLLTSRLEYYYTVVKVGEKDKTKGCPLDQNALYLKETIKNWQPLDNIPGFLKDTAKVKGHTLEERCPKTANAWKVEAALDKAYKWSCDRAFCRKVPAGWTADKGTEEIQNVILQQQQCAVTGRGVPLVKRENCKELIQVNPLAMPAYLKSEDVSSSCWQTADGTLYVVKPEKDLTETEKEETKYGLFHLVHVGGIMEGMVPVKEDLVAYKPDGSENYVVARDQKCEQVCKNPRKPDYKAKSPDPCVEEVNEQGITKTKLEPNQYLAGYTQDCFVDLTIPLEPKFKQCVCEGQKEEVALYQNNDLTLRTAVKKEAGKEEQWFYQQERIFTESGHSKGTYYPKERYYSGRDFSSAFGANYLTDYLRSNNTVAAIDPHSDFLATIQTVCFAGMIKNLVMYESILVGLRNCLVQAKYTGLQDAGMCKTMFAQHVCGLVYKAISALGKGCSPTNFDDVEKGGVFGDVGVIVSEGTAAMSKGLDTSVTDLKEDYGNAVFNDYFNAGTQGFAQSLCLAAFGYDFPWFNKNFLMEAAYAFPMASSVVVAPAYRALAAYNPAKQTAVYNYEIGAVILPGCKIRNWKVSLKCIGPEDLSYKGVDPSCLGQGCDCLNAQSSGSPLEAEKEQPLLNGFDLTSGQMFEVPLESPQRLDTHYRYDHVKVELVLDPLEKGNEQACFDSGYSEGGKAVFYFPIKDVTPKQELACKADLVTGRYVCPELYEMFGFGGAYLEEPYVTCWNKRTESWTDCTASNLFILGDEIKVKTHLVLDGKGKCLKRKVLGIPGIAEETIFPLPENAPGPLYREDLLGVVREEMLGGGYNNIRLREASNSRCGLEVTYTPSQIEGYSHTYEFRFVPQGEDQIQLVVPGDAYPVTSGYTKSGEYLSKGGTTTFTISEVNGVEFELGGFRIKNVLQNFASPELNALEPQNQICSYTTGAASEMTSTNTINAKDLSVTYELWEQDESGGCISPTQPVKTNLGKSSHTQRIRIQRQETFSEAVSLIHQTFLSGGYDAVITSMLNVVKRLEGSLDDAVAIYYMVASYILKGQKESQNIAKYQTEIINLLKLFFDRSWGGQTAKAYPDSVRSTGEYQKIEAYLCCVAKKFGQNGYSACSEDHCGELTGLSEEAAEALSPSAETSAGTSVAATTCGHSQANFIVQERPAGWKPTNWENYVCQESTGKTVYDHNNPGQIDLNKVCWDRGVYSTDALAQQLGVAGAALELSSAVRPGIDLRGV